MRKRLYPRAPRRVWLTAGGLASAAAVVVALTALAGPASAPPMVFVGDTSTPTSTSTPPQTAAPTGTGGPKPSGTPTATAGPTTDGDCLPLVGYDYGSNQYRAMVDCGGGSIEILPRHFDRGSDAQEHAEEAAGRWNSGQGGLPVKAGPGCDPPFVLC